MSAETREWSDAEVARVQGAAFAMYEALEAVEWAGLEDNPDGGHYAACPSCGGGDPDNPATPADYAGHHTKCGLAAALRKARGEG